MRTDIQIRSLKLASFKEVGPGWHPLCTLELLRQEVGSAAARGLLRHVHNRRLQGIRVLDTVRDLGILDPSVSP